MTFDPDMPGLGNLHQTGGPPNDISVKFIRKDEQGRLVVTKDGKNLTFVDPDQLSIKNPLSGKRPR